MAARKKQATDPAAILESLDLGEIRELIDREESELEKLVADRRKHIDALKVLEKAANVRENGNPKRKPRQQKPKADGEESAPRKKPPGRQSDLSKIRTFLDANGPAYPTTIVKATGVNSERVLVLLNLQDFCKLSSGEYELREGYTPGASK